MPARDNIWHLPIEESEQQRTDMRAVDIGVGHDNDLVITQLFNVEIITANARAHCLNERANLLGRQHLVKARALHIQDLTLQGQDRLILAVAALFGRATSGIPFDQEEFGLCRITFLAIGQLAGQGGNVHHALSPGQFARPLGRFTGGSGVDDLLDHGARIGGVFLKPFGHLIRHQAFERLTHFG